MGDFLTEHLRANPQQAPDEDELRTLRPGAARSYGHAQMLARLLDYADRANPRFVVRPRSQGPRQPRRFR